MSAPTSSEIESVEGCVDLSVSADEFHDELRSLVVKYTPALTLVQRVEQLQDEGYVVVDTRRITEVSKSDIHMDIDHILDVIEFTFRALPSWILLDSWAAFFVSARRILCGPSLCSLWPGSRY